MYKLTLTKSEREAFDWVGNRYAAGEIGKLLHWCEWSPDDVDWNGEDQITFLIPEHIAWEINRLAEEESFSWPCFSAELTNKLNELCFSIV